MFVCERSISFLITLRFEFNKMPQKKKIIKETALVLLDHAPVEKDMVPRLALLVWFFVQVRCFGVSFPVLLCVLFSEKLCPSSLFVLFSPNLRMFVFQSQRQSIIAQLHQTPLPFLPASGLEWFRWEPKQLFFVDRVLVRVIGYSVKINILQGG